MSVCQSFLDLFNKTARTSFANKTICTDFFVVDECNPNQSSVPLTTLQVKQIGSNFTSFNDKLVKNMKDITTKRSCFLLDKDCDGVAFVSNNNSEGLILVELKSRFNIQHIEEAFKQMTFSYLKLHAMFSLCKDYTIDALSIKFVAACQCFEDNNQRDFVYNELNKVGMLPNPTFNGRFLRKLIDNKTMVVKLGSITNIWKIPLSNYLIDKQLTLSLQFTQAYGDASAIHNL